MLFLGLIHIYRHIYGLHEQDAAKRRERGEKERKKDREWFVELEGRSLSEAETTCFRKLRRPFRIPQPQPSLPLFFTFFRCVCSCSSSSCLACSYCMLTMCNTEAATQPDEFLGEADSAYGDDSDRESQTTSLKSSVTNYVYENGRRYHAFRQGTYWFVYGTAVNYQLGLFSDSVLGAPTTSRPATTWTCSTICSTSHSTATYSWRRSHSPTACSI